MRKLLGNFWRWLTGGTPAAGPSTAQRAAAQFLQEKLKQDSERLLARQAAKEAGRRGFLLLPELSLSTVLWVALAAVVVVGIGVWLSTKLDGTSATTNDRVAGAQTGIAPTSRPSPDMRIRDYCPDEPWVEPTALGSTDFSRAVKCRNGVRRFRLVDGR